MATAMTTVADLIHGLDGLRPETPLGFVTQAGEIGGDYHITELKLAEIRSVDCGGRQSHWLEANLQLLDGPAVAPTYGLGDAMGDAMGGDWLPAGKVVAILRRCLAVLPDLADVPLSIEFSHGNTGLMRFQPGPLERRGARAVVPLVADGAQCKPAAETDCCAPATEAGCCGPSTAPRTATRCCG